MPGGAPGLPPREGSRLGAVSEATAGAIWSGPGDGEHIWFLGALVTIKVPGEAVDGRCTMLEFLIPQGVSPPKHWHPQDETFTLLDGELTFVAGDERFTCVSGTSWIVPKEVPHTLRI